MSAVMHAPPRLPPAGSVVGWCAALFLIAGALLPLVPPLLSAGAPLVLEVSGEFRRVEPADVRSALTGPLQSDFWQLDLQAVRQTVEALPWVAAARVERVWPATVRVHVEEHEPFARWNGDALLSESGAVFTPRPEELRADLPHLAGPPGHEAEVRAAFSALREHLVGGPFEPTGLRRDARGEWTATTADGIELKLGRGAPSETVARAAASLGGPVRMALQGRFEEVAYVDLHYINGFAVGWRGERAGGASERAGPARRNE